MMMETSLKVAMAAFVTIMIAGAAYLMRGGQLEAS